MTESNNSRPDPILLLFLCAILLIAVGVAYAGVLRGTATAMNADKSSIAVKSDDDKKEYRFECDKEVIEHKVKIGKRVIVYYEKVGDTKKPTMIKPDGGC